VQAVTAPQPIPPGSFRPTEQESAAPGVQGTETIVCAGRDSYQLLSEKGPSKIRLSYCTQRLTHFGRAPSPRTTPSKNKEWTADVRPRGTSVVPLVPRLSIGPRGVQCSNSWWRGSLVPLRGVRSPVVGRAVWLGDLIEVVSHSFDHLVSARLSVVRLGSGQPSSDGHHPVRVAAVAGPTKACCCTTACDVPVSPPNLPALVALPFPNHGEH